MECCGSYRDERVRVWSAVVLTEMNVFVYGVPWFLPRRTWSCMECCGSYRDERVCVWSAVVLTEMNVFVYGVLWFLPR